MRDYHINIFYSEDDDGYIADIPDLEACSAFGETHAEAAVSPFPPKPRLLRGVYPERVEGLAMRPSRSFSATC